MTDLPASPAAAAAATTTTTTTTTTTKTNALCVGTATPLSGSGVSSTSEEIPSFRSARRDLLIVMKILCIFTRWLPGTIKFITLYCFAAVTASVFILLLLFSFSMHVHFAKQMHLPKTLGVFAPEANVKIILSMAIICWLGVISLGVVVVSKFFILPGNFGCTSKVFWNLYTGISAVFFTVVKITALVITTLPCIRNPIYPAVAQTVLFLVLSSFVLLFLPYRLRLANQITAAEVFSCCLCSLFSLVASILYNFEINKVLPLFIASMCIIPVACALGFLAVLFRYKRIVGKMSKITFAEDPSDLESMAITKTTADPKSSSYTFSWQVLLASVCVESSLSDPCLKSGILHFGVKKFPESFSLWLAYAEAIMSKDMQVANFCLQNSSKLIPKWFIPAQFNLFGLDRIRREQEQQTEETIIRQLISAAKYHGKALYYIHSFWTLLLGEYVGQRPLSRIVIKLEKTEKQCDELFEKPSSAVLRAYAEYLADVKQNFVQAQQLHAMAEAMETRHEEQNNAKQTLGRHQPMMQDNPTAQPIVAEFAISEVGDPEENAMLDNALDEANTFQQDELAQQEKIRNQLELSFRSHAFSRFSFSVYFMNFISIVVLVVSFALARTAFKQRQADFNLIATAGGMRSAELQGSYGTRTMQLVNSNMRYLDNFNMTTFGSDVVSSTLELESAAKDLFFHYDTSYPAVFEAWHNQDLQSINYIPLIDEIETLNTTLWLFISAYKAKVFDAVGFYNGETNAEEGQEAFLYVNSNGALQLWSGVWRLVTAYEERFHAQTTRTFVMTLCVLSSCALVPLLAFSLILLPSLYSLNRERLLVHQLFLQIPKASVSEICEKVTAKLEQKKAITRD
ncbi:hypothetical protein Pelo_11953 [Pelomyxa schiedti]|nr:hypothetical protein Pelo_11953 [Pelomyxa schiedti]